MCLLHLIIKACVSIVFLQTQKTLINKEVTLHLDLKTIILIVRIKTCPTYTVITIIGSFLIDLYEI